MSLLLASVVLAALTPGQVPAVSDQELLDQYGRADSLAAHREHIVVGMVVTARRLRNLKGWEKQLRERYDDIHFVRIADVPAEPPVTYDQVAQKLVKRVPEEVPILIDIERRWALELELDTARPMITWGNKEKVLRPVHVIERTQMHIYHHQGQILAMCRAFGKPGGGVDYPIT